MKNFTHSRTDDIHNMIVTQGKTIETLYKIIHTNKKSRSNLSAKKIKAEEMAVLDNAIAFAYFLKDSVYTPELVKVLHDRLRSRLRTEGDVNLALCSVYVLLYLDNTPCPGVKLLLSDLDTYLLSNTTVYAQFKNTVRQLENECQADLSGSPATTSDNGPGRSDNRSDSIPINTLLEYAAHADYTTKATLYNTINILTDKAPVTTRKTISDFEITHPVPEKFPLMEISLNPRRGYRADFIKIINTLFELDFFTTKNANATTKKNVFAAFGKTLNTNFSTYYKDLNNALNTTSNYKTASRIFNDMINEFNIIYSRKS